MGRGVCDGRVALGQCMMSRSHQGCKAKVQCDSRGMQTGMVREKKEREGGKRKSEKRKVEKNNEQHKGKATLTPTRRGCLGFSI